MKRQFVTASISSALLGLYRLLIRCYPSGFRHRYGAGMEQMFRDQVEEACRARPIRAVARLLAREAWGILRTAPAQWLAKLRSGRLRKRMGHSFNPLSPDVRSAVRSLVRRPGFALTVIAQLGLAIAAAVTVFTVVNTVLLRQLPYPNADELVVFGNPGHSLPLYTDWRDRTHSFAAVAGVWSDSRGFAITGDGVPENIAGARVTGEFFQMFGAKAVRGRLLTSDDCSGAPPRVAVVSHGVWQERWGAAEVIGRAITVEGNTVEVVGVLDPAFRVPDALVEGEVGIWLPLDHSSEMLQQRTMNMLSVAARRKAGVSTETAQADVNSLAVVLAEQYPSTDRLSDGSPRRFPLTPLFEATVENVGRLLYTLLGAAGMMLLISCANVASIFLARQTGRTREMALRAALGAGRARIAKQLLAESGLLAVVSGAAGVALACVAVNAFRMLGPASVPRLGEIAVDSRVFGVAFVMSLGCGLLFGIAPALLCSRPGTDGVLRSAESGVPGESRPMAMRRMLLVAEVAVGLILLVGAGLFLRSFVKLIGVEGGFEPENVWSMPLNLGPSFTEEERLQFTYDLLERIGAIPGVAAVGAGPTLPPYRDGRCCWFAYVGTDSEAEDPPFAMLHPVTPGYFDVLGSTILRGRGFTDADSHSQPPQSVINETLARVLFADADPIGKHILAAGERWTVIGVVNDIRHWGLQRESGANAYIPHALHGGPFSSLQVAVKSRLDPATLTAALRDAVWSTDADLPIREITPIQHNISRSVATPRFLSILITAFAALGILLAAGGMYGFVTYSVRQRRRELGIRTALGAGSNDLMALVVRRALSLILIGLTLGLAGAFALSRLLEGLLYGVTSTDPTAFAVAALVVGVAALAACYPPTREATTANPIDTLRAQ